MGPFDLLEDIASATLDIINAETFILTPVEENNGVNGRRTMSATRPAVALILPSGNRID